jgi:signal transduction histidine kinase
MRHEDITEKKDIENQMNELRSELIHSTRAGTMVELTAALAHELNHPLGSILNNANAARRILGTEYPDMNEIKEIIDDIVSEDRRASDVMQRLRALMKKTEVEFGPVHINNILKEVIEFMRSELIINNISLSQQLEKGLPMVNGDRTQIQQVFLNLIINACDAMKESKAKDLLISSKIHNKDTVIVQVKDKGCSIGEKEKAKLFKPFFTTKKEGMGMGLSVCRTIIRTHGGDIWAENNEDGGASFFVTLQVHKTS